MQGTHRVYAVRAHLLEMAGDHEAAIERYLLASRRTTSVPERHYLEQQAARLTAAAAERRGQVLEASRGASQPEHVQDLADGAGAVEVQSGSVPVGC